MSINNQSFLKSCIQPSFVWLNSILHHQCKSPSWLAAEQVRSISINAWTFTFESSLKRKRYSVPYVMACCWRSCASWLFLWHILFFPVKEAVDMKFLIRSCSTWNWSEWVAGWRVREKESGLLISFSSISLFNGPELLYYYQICFRGLIWFWLLLLCTQY